MNISQESFEFKKGFFDSSFNLIFITLIGIPVIFFRNGFLDLSYFPFFFIFYGLLLYLSLRKVFKIKISETSTEFTDVFGTKKIIPNNKISYSENYIIRKDWKVDFNTQTIKLEIQFSHHNVTLYKNEEQDYDELKRF